MCVPRFAIMGDESIQDIVARANSGAHGARAQAGNAKPAVEAVSGGPGMASAA